jgi:hypothetical protein
VNHEALHLRRHRQEFEHGSHGAVGGPQAAWHRVQGRHRRDPSKLASAIAAAVLDEHQDLAIEEEDDAKILIQADWSMSYGEMSAEIERAEEHRREPAAKPHPPREGGP